MGITYNFCGFSDNLLDNNKIIVLIRALYVY